MLQARKRQLLFEGGDDADFDDEFSDLDITGDEAPAKWGDRCPDSSAANGHPAAGLRKRLRGKCRPQDIPIHSDGSADASGSTEPKAPSHGAPPPTAPAPTAATGNPKKKQKRKGKAK